MTLFGENNAGVGEVTDGPIPRTGTHEDQDDQGRGRRWWGGRIFTNLNDHPSRAALELFNKLKVKLEERGQL